MSFLEGCDQVFRKSSRQFADSVLCDRVVATRLEQRDDTAQKAEFFGLGGQLGYSFEQRFRCDVDGNPAERSEEKQTGHDQNRG